MSIEKSLFFLIILFFLSCKKDKVVDCPKSFDIIEIAVDSNRVITSIDTFINHPSGCGVVPSPSDSLDVDSLDLNPDGIKDCYINAKTWYQMVSASYPCANYSHSVVLSTIQNDIQFTKSGFYNQFGYFDENELIDSTKDWSESIMFSLSVPQAPFSCYYQGIHYIGYRVIKNG